MIGGLRVKVTGRELHANLSNQPMPFACICRVTFPRNFFERQRITFPTQIAGGAQLCFRSRVSARFRSPPSHNGGILPLLEFLKPCQLKRFFKGGWISAPFELTGGQQESYSSCRRKRFFHQI
jgi:hypothetical protein